MLRLPSQLEVLPFSELLYQRPDINAFSEQANRAKNLFQKWNKAKNLRDASLRFQRTVDGYEEAKTLASIQHALCADDPYYSEETLFFNTVDATVERLIQSVHGWLRQKSSAAELRSFLGSAFMSRAAEAHQSLLRRDRSSWEATEKLRQDFLQLREQGKSSSATAWMLFARYLQLNRGEVQANREEPGMDFQLLRDLLRQYLPQFLPYILHGDDPQDIEEGRPLLQEAEQTLVHALSLDREDYAYGINSLFNRCSEQKDVFLHLHHLGYVDLAPDLHKADGVECFYLPQTGIPFLFARAESHPRFVHHLLRETGKSCALLLAEEEHDFTPFILPGRRAEEFICSSFVLMAQPHMDLFYGKQASFYCQWQLRYILLRLLRLLLLDLYYEKVSQLEEAKASQLRAMWNRQHRAWFGRQGLQSLFPEEFYEDFPMELLQEELGSRLQDQILGIVLALLGHFQLRKRGGQQELEAWGAFCRAGSVDQFLPRLLETGYPVFLRKDELKRLIYRLSEELGY